MVKEESYIHGFSIARPFFLSLNPVNYQAVQAYALSFVRYDLTKYTIWLH